MYRLTRASRQLPSLTSTAAVRAFSAQAARMSDDKSALDANKGSIGKQFNPDGKVGQTAEQVGGPFERDGAIGKQFTSGGAVGGAGQAVAEQAQGDRKPMLDKDGAIGKRFQPDGAIGSVGEAVGGPFSKDGAIGKQFTDKGAVGGTVQEKAGSGKGS